LETFTELKEFVGNPHYKAQRLKSLGDLADNMIDAPIIDLINGFNKLPFCFTLQSCYGHFVYNGQKDTHNLEPLPVKGVIAKVEYRIAYIALSLNLFVPTTGSFDQSVNGALTEKDFFIPCIHPTGAG
jgi:hypothetical protein